MSDSRKDEDLVRIFSATCNVIFLLYLPYGRGGLLKPRAAAVPKWLVLVKVVSQPTPPMIEAPIDVNSRALGFRSQFFSKPFLLNISSATMGM